MSEQGPSPQATDRWEDLYESPEIYDAQYRTYREDLGFYRRLTEDHGGPILEIGCGTGRVTVELARAGAEVVGVDRAPSMLERARRRIVEAGLGDRVRLVRADMRELHPAEGWEQDFALAVVPFNTLMHAFTLEDQDRVLAGAFARLEPGGVFACDVYVPRFGEMGVVRTEPSVQRVLGPETDIFLVQEHDEAGQRITTTYFIDRLDDGGIVKRRRVRLVQRYFRPFELERAVRAAGFERVRIYGSFERTPFRESSDSIVVLAVKPRS